MVSVTIMSDFLNFSASSQRLARSLASLEAKKSRIIAFCWEAVWDFEILDGITGSISVRIFFSSQPPKAWSLDGPKAKRRICDWSPGFPQRHTGWDLPQRTHGPTWDPWLRTGSTNAFVDLSGLEGVEFMGIAGDPPVMTHITMENHHRNNGFFR